MWVPPWSAIEMNIEARPVHAAGIGIGFFVGLPDAVDGGRVAGITRSAVVEFTTKIDDLHDGSLLEGRQCWRVSGRSARWRPSAWQGMRAVTSVASVLARRVPVRSAMIILVRYGAQRVASEGSPVAGTTHLAFPRRDAPGSAFIFRPRGRGECRAHDAPAVWRAEKNATPVVVTTGSPGKPGIPAREWF